MWKSQVGLKASDRSASQKDDDDDFDTDPDYVNDASEKQLRWGRAAPDAAAINFHQLSQQVQTRDSEGAKKALSTNPAFGYGGKFGVEKDRMDKSAVGHEFKEEVEKHASQTDYAKGFGGKFGVQADRKDQSAVGWDHQEKVDKHSSQTDYAKGFGGRYGVQGDRQDKSAVGWSHVEKTEKHASQTDYSHGFGGKFGVQTDRKDASAHDWDEGQSSAPKPSATPNRPSGPLTDTKSLRSRFEAMAVSSDNPQSDAVAKQRAQRKEQEEKEKQTQRSVNARPVETKAVSPTPVPAPVESQTQRHVETENSYQPIEPRPVAVGCTLYQPPADFKKEPEVSHNNVEHQPTWEEQQPISHQETDFHEPEVQQEEEYYQHSETPAAVHNEEPSEDLGITAIALYDYDPAESDELGFDPGDMITHIEKIDEGWWKGSCGGRVGLFPANYVQEN